MKYILLSIILISGLSWANNIASKCDKHPLYCSILKANPKINKKYAMKLSNVIWKTGVRYNIDRFLIVAIFAQESMFKLNAQNCTYGLLKRSKKEALVCTDFGIGQIHYMNVKRQNIDVDRLLTDMIYSVDVSVRMLANFKRRHGNKEKEWWTRYNTSTPSKRRLYKKLVCRYYNGRNYCNG